MSRAAEQQCPLTMTSVDGTHAPPLVNLMQVYPFLVESPPPLFNLMQV